MSVVTCVTVAVMDVVDVTFVRNGHVAAPLAVLVRVAFVRGVCIGHALVDVASWTRCRWASCT